MFFPIFFVLLQRLNNEIMKRLLLLIMFLPLALYAQEDYKPLLKEGRTWNHSFTSIFREYSENLTIQGDTLIGGSTWKKVYSGSQYVKALREDGRKVYELEKDKPSGSQQLLFDFGLQVGERQYFAPYESEVRYLEVTGIDHINSEGREYRILKLSQVIKYGDETVYNTDNSYWIEGIGGECGIMKPCQWVDVAGYTCQLQSCYDDEECIFNSTSLYNGITIPKSDKLIDSVIYDLNGRQNHYPSKGLYIENGRKRIVR